MSKRDEITKAVETIIEALKTDEGKHIINDLKITVKIIDNVNGEIIENYTSKPKLRVEYSEDRKHAYFNGKIFHKQKDGHYSRRESLQNIVMEYYTGKPVISGYEVHHNAKDEYGNYDKNKNDIEHLVLLTKSEHLSLHKNCELKEEIPKVCRNCGKEFKTKNAVQVHCCEQCSYDYHRNRQVKRKCLFPNCNEEFWSKIGSSRKYCDKHKGKPVKIK